ncbi:MAG: WD40/YVTN/BNR-like repeat-containing protein, partial [Candidatus Aminicenantales bacterium]
MKTRTKQLSWIVGMLAFTIGLAAEEIENPIYQSWAAHRALKQSTPFRLEWIPLGPVMNSARVEAVQAHPARPGMMLVAFGSGNLWKTADNGLTWRPIFEDQPVLGIGDVAIAPSDPDVIWLGTGESLKKARNFTMPGMGVFRSVDGGDTWDYLGLPDSYHIGEIAVHPENPDIAFVAVLGHFWTPNPNRGLYRTRDGGKTWEHVLYVDEHTGANDVVIAPSNPQVVYASMWENYPDVAGPNSGIYKSTDGGTTWVRLRGGLPEGPRTGRIGLAVSWSRPARVYALIDNLNQPKNLAAEIYRSDDGGRSWHRTHKEPLYIVPGIGWYFADCYVNPQDDEEIYALGVRIAHSRDGGKTFDLIGGKVFHVFPNPAECLHLDHCEMWVDWKNPRRLILGNDGGLYVSYDSGKSWLHCNNIPAGEFYDISVDSQEPYRVYGGTQDDAAVYGPARDWDPRFPDGWEYIWLDAWAGGDGCFTVVDPAHPIAAGMGPF